MPTATTYFCIVYRGAQIMDPDDPTKALLFASEEAANIYISEHSLNPIDCKIFPVIIVT
jgi:hypothetical protein